MTVLQRTIGRLEAELAERGKQKLFDNLKCYLMSTTKVDERELIAFADGYRKSTKSWRELILDAKNRGLSQVARMAWFAEKHWRRLNGRELLTEVIEGIKFVDGIKDIAA